MSVTFFNVPPGNKDAVVPNSLAKEESCCVYKCDANAYQGRLNDGFPKVCEIFKLCAIESLKYILNQFVIVATFPRPET